MNRRACEGEGAGWGTIAGKRLRILILASSERHDDAMSIARALEPRHTVKVHAGGGVARWLTAARAARDLAPHLIHAVGAKPAKPAEAVAAGLAIPLVLSLDRTDLERRTSRRLLRTLRTAAGVLAGDVAAADLLRGAGILRTIYVLAPPKDREDDPPFANALEIVYGRIIAGAGPPVPPGRRCPAAQEASGGASDAPEDEEPVTATTEPPLVHLGGVLGAIKKGGGDRGDP